MYLGEARVLKEELPLLIKAAENLQVWGLSPTNNELLEKSSKDSFKSSVENTSSKEKTSNSHLIEPHHETSGDKNFSKSLGFGNPIKKSTECPTNLETNLKHGEVSQSRTEISQLIKSVQCKRSLSEDLTCDSKKKRFGPFWNSENEDYPTKLPSSPSQGIDSSGEISSSTPLKNCTAHQGLQKSDVKAEYFYSDNEVSLKCLFRYIC